MKTKLFQHKHKFEVIRTIWPYADGWGTWCPSCKLIVDTGLEKPEAEERCSALNNDHRERGQGVIETIILMALIIVLVYACLVIWGGISAGVGH